MPRATLPDLALPAAGRPPVPSPLPDTLSPADRYQELFVAVQSSAVFADSKTFVDCAPRHSPEEILAAYRTRRDRPGFNLASFVHSAFTLPRAAHDDFVSAPGRDMCVTGCLTPSCARGIFGEAPLCGPRAHRATP